MLKGKQMGSQEKAGEVIKGSPKRKGRPKRKHKLGEVDHDVDESHKQGCDAADGRQKRSRGRKIGKISVDASDGSLTGADGVPGDGINETKDAAFAENELFKELADGGSKEADLSGSSRRYELRRMKQSRKGKIHGQRRSKILFIKDDKGNILESLSNMCHQCQRNDKGRVVRCTKCITKRYCIPCITKWYPDLSEEAIAEACPVCCYNCNCKSCMRMEFDRLKKKLEEQADTLNISEDDQIRLNLFLLQAILPFLELLNEEQLKEKELEATIQGLQLSALQVKNIECPIDERMHCKYCKTSIADFHRSCPLCSYDLCLTCCREIREGHPQGGAKEVVMDYVDRGLDYLYGGKGFIGRRSKAKPVDSERSAQDPANRDTTALVSSQTDCSGLPTRKEVDDQTHLDNGIEWKANADGSIPCPPKEYGGCSGCLLELRSMFATDVTELMKKAKEVVATLSADNIHELSDQSCSCITSFSDDDDSSSFNARKASSRGDSNDDHLYCPDAVDISAEHLRHFQWHWARAEPVIVRNVLDTKCGLSWDPMVMWRAFRQITNLSHSRLLDVKTIDCFDFCEVCLLFPSKPCLCFVYHRSLLKRASLGAIISCCNDELLVMDLRRKTAFCSKTR
ncbi:hypothetical protein Dimus_019461 [Dionaea muscipula]